MKRQKSYCCYCGSSVERREVEFRQRDVCEKCGVVFYENPLPVASSILVNDNREVLLVKRKKDPYKGMWCLPIGFAESGEEVSQAALRELAEETGITGEIIRLIDVDTVDNYFYGSLAIVTYEVKMAGGKLQPGDDALDAGYFPLTCIPELAWSSNEKALEIYRKMHSDEWAMIDSFKKFFPESTDIISMKSDRLGTGRFLSDIMVKLIDMDMDNINSEWINDVKKNIPSIEGFSDTMAELNMTALKDVRSWLKGEEIDYKIYISKGRALKKNAARLPDILTAMALSRKSIWLHVIKKRILSTPLEIYSTLELNNRVIFFYDRINYFITEGFCSS